MTLENVLKKITFLLISILGGSIGLAIFGIFSKQNITILLIFALVISIFFSLKNFILDKAKIKATKIDIAVIALLVFFSIFIGMFHHDYSRGRDEMVHYISAAHLTKTETLVFNDLEAESFSGLTRTNDNTKLTPQFLPGYITSLALFYEISGNSSIYYANAILIFLGLISIYFVGKHIRNQKVGLTAVIFFSTLYTTLWFSMRFNSEVLFFALFWITIWFFLESYKREKIAWYFLSLVPLALLLLTRGEGLLYAGLYLVVTPFILAKKPKEAAKRFFKKRFLPIALLPTSILFFYIYYLSIFNVRYITSQIENFKAALNIFPPIILALAALFLVGITILYTFVKNSTEFDFKKERQRILFAIILLCLAAIQIYHFVIAGDFLNWKFYRLQFSLEMMTYYMITFYIIIVLYGLFLKKFKKAHFHITLLSLPSFIFLIESNIAPDQPWFMRRFFAVFIPLMIILASDIFYTIKTKYSEQKIALYFGVIVLNIIVAFPIIGFIDNKGMQEKITELSNNFTTDDLILLEPGWNWQKWTYPIRFIDDKKVIANNNSPIVDQQKNEYIVSLTQKYPDWLSDNNQVKEIKKAELEYSLSKMKSNIENNQNIYIITEKPEEYPFYSIDNLENKNKVHLEYTTLTPSTQILGMIEKDGSMLERKALLSAQKNTPPYKKEVQENELYILKVIDPKKIEIKNNMTNEEIVIYRNFITTLLRK